MGTNERKEREKKIRQEDILNAAEQVFSQKGYEQSTMDEIAKTAEYSKRTLYIYFQSKEQLLHGIIFRAYKTINTMIDHQINQQPHQTGLEKLKLLGNVYMEFIDQHPKYFETMIFYNSSKSELPDDDEFKKRSDLEGEKTLTYLIQILEEGISDQSIRQDIHVQKTAFVLYANVIGLSNLIANKESYLQEHHLLAKDLIYELFEFVERSVERSIQKRGD